MTYRLGDMQLSPDMVGYLEAARRFLLREPERSRRVLRLLCANWLAEVETHEPRPPKPAVRASFLLMISTNPIRKVTTSVPLYPVSPRSPAGARALPPQEVADWLVATNDVKLRILVANTCQWPWSPDRLRDRRAYRELVIMLAEKIYRRERGALRPPRKPWSGPISRACPTTGRPTWPMRGRRQSSSGFGCLGPAAAEVIPDALEPNLWNWWTRLEPYS